MNSTDAARPLIQTLVPWSAVGSRLPLKSLPDQTCPAGAVFARFFPVTVTQLPGEMAAPKLAPLTTDDTVVEEAAGRLGDGFTPALSQANAERIRSRFPESQLQFRTASGKAELPLTYTRPFPGCATASTVY